MENLETYIYIFFALLYIITRIIKARAKQNQQQQQQVEVQKEAIPQPVRQSPPRKKAFSFDDILKEFEKNLAGDEYEDEQPLPVEELRHEKPKPVVVSEHAKPANPYQNYEPKKRFTEKDGMKEKELTFKRSEKFAIKEAVTNPFVEKLQSAEGFRDAVVLSEIINRKYF